MMPAGRLGRRRRRRRYSTDVEIILAAERCSLSGSPKGHGLHYGCARSGRFGSRRSAASAARTTGSGFPFHGVSKVLGTSGLVLAYAIRVLLRPLLFLVAGWLAGWVAHTC